MAQDGERPKKKRKQEAEVAQASEAGGIEGHLDPPNDLHQLEKKKKKKKEGGEEMPSAMAHTVSPPRSSKKSVKFVAEAPEVAPDPVYSPSKQDGDIQDFASGILGALAMIEEDPKSRREKDEGKPRKKSFRQRMKDAAPMVDSVTEDNTEGAAEVESPTSVLQKLMKLSALQEHSMGNVLRAVERGRQGMVVVSSDFEHLKVSQKDRLYYALQDAEMLHVVVPLTSAVLGKIAGKGTAMALMFQLNSTTEPLCHTLKTLGSALVKDWF